MTTDASRRAFAVLVFAATIAGVGLTDRLVARPPSPTPGRGPADAVSAGYGASSSVWYCAAAAGAPAGTRAAVVVTDPSTRALSGTIVSSAAGGAPSPGTRVTVAARGQLTVPIATGAAARVVLDGGATGVFEMVSGPLGWSAAPCASTTAARWYFAGGSTAGRSLELSLYDPTPADAVVDVTVFSAEGGVVAPPAYQGVPVPAGGLVVENLSDHVQNDPAFAIEVTALSGAVVAGETAEAGGPGNGGLSLVAGVSAPDRRWAFAQSTDVNGGGNHFSILNPSDRAVTVDVSIALSQGQAAPLRVAVPAATVASVATQNQTRIPPNAPFGLTFTSSGGGIVVSRETSVASGTMPTIGDSVGVPGTETRWLVPPVPTPPGAGPWTLGVLDLGGRPAHVTLGTRDGSGRLLPVAGEHPLVVPRGGLLALGPGPGSPVGRQPFEARSDEPVALELDPQPAGAPGTVVLPVWPLPGPAG